MLFKLDFHGKEPIYLQLVEQVKQQIAAGALAPGAQLPTVREVAAELRINFNTAARAYRLLHEEGVISTQQGRGTYILGAPKAASPAERQKQLQNLIAIWKEETKRLGYSVDEVDRAWAENIK
jgi:DNA-binding transcriptional regulator YhcF (GntR family)